MELSIHQQIFEYITKANRILVALPYELNPDIASSGLALSLYLQKLSKDVTLASSGSLPISLSFLPKPGPLHTRLESGKDLVVTLDTTNKALDELSYRTGKSRVDIFLKAKEGSFSPEEISFGSSQIPYDLVITLGCQSLESLGSLFRDHAEVFYETPKINIDYHPANEQFGAINLVDITATSVSEILAGLLSKFESQLIDEDIATCLLSGIIANTNSFQHIHTTPQALLASADLINLGGRQQDIIKHLFKTKPLSLLQLWGRALARVRTSSDKSFIYSVLTAADFSKTGSTDAEVIPVMSELLDNTSSYHVIALLAELPTGKIRLFLALRPPRSFEPIMQGLGAAPSVPVPLQGLYQIASSDLSFENIGEAESKLVEVLKQNLQQSAK